MGVRPRVGSFGLGDATAGMPGNPRNMRCAGHMQSPYHEPTLRWACQHPSYRTREWGGQRQVEAAPADALARWVNCLALPGNQAVCVERPVAVAVGEYGDL